MEEVQFTMERNHEDVFRYRNHELTQLLTEQEKKSKYWLEEEVCLYGNHVPLYNVETIRELTKYKTITQVLENRVNVLKSIYEPLYNTAIQCITQRMKDINDKNIRV